MIAINMEMPKCCTECPFKVNDYVCGQLDCAFSCNKFKERNYNCPLVEIVTCKDCKYYRPDDDTGYCTNHTHGDIKFWCRDDYYCEDAERREKNDRE